MQDSGPRPSCQELGFRPTLRLLERALGRSWARDALGEDEVPCPSWLVYLESYETLLLTSSFPFCNGGSLLFQHSEQTSSVELLHTLLCKPRFPRGSGEGRFLNDIFPVAMLCATSEDSCVFGLLRSSFKGKIFVTFMEHKDGTAWTAKGS